jgi:AcrR family transcriptional regulator
MDQALDAAAEVFAEVGYEKATTNLIAARAGMSPGSLYQFFRNKEAIAEALAGRYATQLAASHAAAFLRPGAASVPLGNLIGQVIDPMIAFHVANPAARILLQSADLSPALAARTWQLHEAALRRAEGLVAARAPGLPPDERARVASVTFQVFKGMLPAILAAGPDERDALVCELKTVLLRYLEPIEHGH